MPGGREWMVSHYLFENLPRPQNLWVGDGSCRLLRAPQLIRKTSVFNGFQGALNMLRTSYESSANWSSNSKVMPLQQE